ncbi:MAG: transferase [Chryseobacterium sp.]|nr:MAG: transferase [Chryseobacterium sp.]
MIKKIFRIIGLFIINKFLSTTRFFFLKNIILRFCGISVGENSKVVGPIEMGTVATLAIGSNTWIGSGLKIYGNGNVIIGDNCDLAPDIAFVTGSHEIGDEKRRAGEGISFNIEIDNGCWIGARVTIAGNIKINTGSIVGTSALVNKDVFENTIVAGVPAKIIKKL